MTDWKSMKVTRTICLLFIFACLILQQAPNRKLPSSVAAANYYEMTINPYYVALGVKGYQQTTDYTCGPAAVMSLLRWYHLLKDSDMNADTERRIAEEMGTGDMKSRHPGTSPQQMINWLQAHGFSVTSGDNGTLELIRSNLKQDVPVLVDWIDWGGHWVVATGYYAASEAPNKGVDTIFFADSAAHWTCPKNPDGISSFNALRFRDMWFSVQYAKPNQITRSIYIIAVPNKLPN
ncbi:MAG TPA: peptidase C39 family protein [Negativicutes bacterium]